MKLLAALLSILIIAWLALRLRPAVRQRVFGIERGAAMRVGAGRGVWRVSRASYEQYLAEQAKKSDTIG